MNATRQDLAHAVARVLVQYESLADTLLRAGVDGSELREALEACIARNQGGVY